MAYGGASNYKDNFGRWQKTITVNLKKHLLKEAEQLQVDIGQVVADKLEEVHRANVVASYYPRSKGEQAKAEYNKTKKAEEKEDLEKYDIKSRRSRKTLSYIHTGTLEEAIHTEVEQKNKYECRVVVKIRPEPYPVDHPRRDNKLVTAVDVYQWLREGTKGGSDYWFTNKQGKRPTAHNYSTPAHLFELHTTLQMKGFIDSLDVKKYARIKRYSLKRR